MEGPDKGVGTRTPPPQPPLHLPSSRPATRLIASIASCLPACLHTRGEGGADSSGGRRALSTVTTSCNTRVCALLDHALFRRDMCRCCQCVLSTLGCFSETLFFHKKPALKPSRGGRALGGGGCTRTRVNEARCRVRPSACINRNRSPLPHFVHTTGIRTASTHAYVDQDRDVTVHYSSTHFVRMSAPRLTDRYNVLELVPCQASLHSTQFPNRFRDGPLINMKKTRIDHSALHSIPK